MQIEISIHFDEVEDESEEQEKHRNNLRRSRRIV